MVFSAIVPGRICFSHVVAMHPGVPLLVSALSNGCDLHCRRADSRAHDYSESYLPGKDCSCSTERSLAQQMLLRDLAKSEPDGHEMRSPHLIGSASPLRRVNPFFMSRPVSCKCQSASTR
jgi:hypothetical protein